MLIITLPDIYLEAPLHEHYFVRNPNYLSIHSHHHNDYPYGQDITLLLQYCEEVDKNPAILNMSELWMFATEEKPDGTRGLVNNHLEHYRKTGEVLPYDGPGPNMEKHMDILLFGKKINDKYGIPSCSEIIPLDDGEEVEFRYGLTYRVEKFIDEKRVYVSYDDDNELIKHLTEPPSRAWVRQHARVAATAAKFQGKRPSYRRKPYDNEIVFHYPLSEDAAVRASEHIKQHGISDFLAKTNLALYFPNAFPLTRKQEEMLANLSPVGVLDQIATWIEESSLVWDNVSANTIHNQQVNTAKLAYKGQQYGAQFLLGDMDSLPQGAFVFPLLEDEMYFALDVIEKKGIGFFVEHCVELPDSGYNRNTQEETIANMESLLGQYGAYWLLGQLNATAILAAKGYSVK